MPKLKTHRGAAKRFKKTGTGKFTRSKAFKQHILTSKTRSRKRGLKGTVVVVGRRSGQPQEDAAELTDCGCAVRDCEGHWRVPQSASDPTA